MAGLHPPTSNKGSTCTRCHLFVPHLANSIAVPNMLMSGTVVLLAFISKPENKHVNLEKKLHAFFKGESAELEKITQAIDKVVEDNFNDPKCQWFDDPTVLRMQKRRWYAGTEPLADGSLAIIGGFVNGGYINRNDPNVDPATEGGAAEPTYEFYPSKGQAQVMQFMIDTSGLHSYALTYLMPSGKMLVQANVSTSKLVLFLARAAFTEH